MLRMLQIFFQRGIVGQRAASSSSSLICLV
jgi:hypothetical protein